MKRIRRPSPALVISVIALFVALGGTGYAAITLPKNSVGAKQIKRNAVTSKELKNRSVKAADVATGVIPPSFSGSAAGGDLAGTYPNPTIGDGKVTAAKIAPGAVGGAQLADGSLTAADVAIARGTQTFDPGDINDHECTTPFVFAGSSEVDPDDTLVVTPQLGSSVRILLQGRVDDGEAGVRFCNISDVIVDPAAQPINWVAFEG